MQNNPNQNRSNVSQGGSQDFQNMKFVPRFEMSVMQYVILDKAQQQNGITKENLQQTFRGNLQMSGQHLDHCLQWLVKENHLKEEGGKYTITDDGREDVQKLQTIVLELPNVISRGQQGQQRQGMTQQQSTTGGVGSTGGNVGGGNVGGTGTTGGTTGGNVGGGNVGGGQNRNR